MREPSDLRDIAASLKTLCSQEASRHSVSIETEAPSTLPDVRVDASQLQQALLNVVLNGIQAMPSGGTITIRLEELTDQLRILVEDDGPGVPSDARARLFEPFFTTKPRGTGLGLAIARKLVEAQGGQIRLAESSSSDGACFVITLPNGPNGNNTNNDA